MSIVLIRTPNGEMYLYNVRCKKCHTNITNFMNFGIFFCNLVPYVIRSSKMSLNSNNMKIQFSSAMCASHLELYFGLKKHIKVGLTVQEI